jgi:hypothetical protein
MSVADLPARLARRALRAASGAGRDAASLARAAWLRRPDAHRATASAFAILLASAGLHGLSFQASLPRRLPAAVDWAAARALLERDTRPGDAVAVSPAWAERAREVLPRGVPILPLVSFDHELLAGVRRVWLLSLPGAPGFSWDPELDLVRLAARSEPLPQLGALAVSRYALASPRLPLAFLPDRVASAEVRLGDVPCTSAPGGFRCGAGGTVRVLRTVREVDGRARPCLSVSLPTPPGAPLEIAFPGVPIGRWLLGHAGPAGPAPAAARVRVAVSIDGVEAGAFETAGSGFVPFELATPELAGALRTVTLVFTWAAPAGALCLDAVTLP